MLKSPYEILGVSQGAGMDEIKRAYRKKAKEYHPDLHPDDPTANEKMQQVNQAYDMLCNPDKYRARQQARPNPDSYGQYGQHSYGTYADPNRPRQSAGWQYTYYANDAYSRDAWNRWQEAWNTQAGDRQRRQSSAVVRPFRGVMRLVGGLLLFRFVMSLLRFGFFGFFL